MSLKAIVEDIARLAEDQLERAYRILGAKPGPGIDLLIYPVQPISGHWWASGLTPAGRAFIHKFWFIQPIGSNHELKRLKDEANDWNLKYKVEYPVLSLEEASLEPKVDKDADDNGKSVGGTQGPVNKANQPRRRR